MGFDIVSLIIGGLIMSAVWVVVWLFSGDDTPDDAALLQAFREGEEVGHERAMLQTTGDYRAETRNAWFDGFTTAVHNARANMNEALDEMENS